uniref:Ku domain-containing protein n=1 Tax=Octactis speculum TaxID=3111310 RepID=A0A7S2DHZ8_9STRA|mmetsp:Transcript_48347/g.65802  ORF Transcript_48347/g.65802 Transcript_48347/m.65802 type:complete len:465 (+) Transcript_48347:520-1914(+)
MFSTSAGRNKECSSTYDPLDAKSGGTKTDRNYFCASALDDPVPPEALVKGFRYGKDYVPLSLADREAMKVPSERSELQILAFSPVALTQPEDSIGDTKCIIPVIGNARSEAVVGALAKSLLVAKRQAIVRFVGRKNGDPQLGVLRHDSSCSEYARLILTQIPFDDDIRGYNFPPVNPKLLPSAKQRAAAATVVKQLSLADDAFHLESSFSPVLQRVKQTLIARARDPKVPLPEIDARVKAYMNPSQEMMVHAKSALKSFEEKFKFTAVEKASRKRKHFWSDMADTKDDSSSAPSSSGATGDGVKGEGNGAAVAAGSDGGKQEVGSLNPVEDFDRMMKSVKLVEKALELMRERIIVFVTQGGTAAYRKKAVLCVKALREGCLRESESALFNRFMRDTVKANHETLLEEVQKAGLTLISEEEDSAVYDVTADDAMAFLSTQVKSQAASIVPQDGEDSDESLFDDLE